MPGVDKECEGIGATHWFACKCREKRFEMIHIKNVELEAENRKLRSALSELWATMRTHETAIRHDFGNTNWEVVNEKVNAALKESGGE